MLFHVQEKTDLDGVSCTRYRPAMGRTKLWHERLHLTLPQGAKANIDSVLREDEDRLDLVRLAIDREINRRMRKKERERKAVVEVAPEHDREKAR